MKGRTPPPLSEKEQERRRALLALDVPAMRVWLDRYGTGAFGDDELVLRAMHESRMVDPVMPRAAQRESQEWVRAHYPDSNALKEP